MFHSNYRRTFFTILMFLLYKLGGKIVVELTLIPTNIDSFEYQTSVYMKLAVTCIELHAQ